MPNPVDPSLDRFDNSTKNDLTHDVFCNGHGVHRGVLKKEKLIKKIVIKQLLKNYLKLNLMYMA